MRKKTYFMICFALLLFMPGYLVAWGSATHAYFANKLGESSYYLNLQEIYGALAPDLYKSLFGSSYYHYLESETHSRFDKVARHARGTALKSFAFGFTSHNEVWGADFTSHHDGRTTPGVGYVSFQVESLKATFQDSIEQLLLKSNIDPQQAKAIAAEVAPSVAHIATELSVDILIKRNEDRNIGSKILQAAQLRSSAIPGLLVAAYAEDFARECNLSVVSASAILLGAERGYRVLMTSYGAMFMQSEAELIRQLASYLSNLAELYLKVTKGLNVSIPSATATALLKQTLAHVAPSYAAEIAATLAYLKAEMPNHPGNGQDFAVELTFERASEAGGGLVPEQFSLQQNHPNPFNPTTRIRYALPQPGPVKLLVFNTIGQTVATLVDAYQAAGVYEVSWDAAHLPGGLYIYRLEADGYCASRKMLLQK